MESSQTILIPVHQLSAVSHRPWQHIQIQKVVSHALSLLSRSTGPLHCSLSKPSFYLHRLTCKCVSHGCWAKHKWTALSIWAHTWLYDVSPHDRLWLDLTSLLVENKQTYFSLQCPNVLTFLFSRGSIAFTVHNTDAIFPLLIFFFRQNLVKMMGFVCKWRHCRWNWGWHWSRWSFSHICVHTAVRMWHRPLPHVLWVHSDLYSQLPTCDPSTQSTY